MMDIAVAEYPKIAAVLATSMLVLGLWIVKLLRHDPGSETRGQVMMLLATAFLTSLLVGLLSALRVLGIADALGTETQDRVFRIALIALRLYAVGALVYIVVTLHRGGGA